MCACGCLAVCKNDSRIDYCIVIAILGKKRTGIFVSYFTLFQDVVAYSVTSLAVLDGIGGGEGGSAYIVYMVVQQRYSAKLINL